MEMERCLNLKVHFWHPSSEILMIMNFYHSHVKKLLFLTFLLL